MDRHSFFFEIWLLGASLVWGSAPTTSFSQAVSVPLPSQDELNSPDWTVRRGAFAKLVGTNPENYANRGLVYVARLLRNTLQKEPKNREARRTGLIKLLETENGVVEEKRLKRLASRLETPDEKDLLSEEYVNYYGDVIAAIATLKDPRALNALLGAITTGNMATRTLVSFGKPAVEPVTQRLQHPDPRVRVAATWTLSQMLEASEIANDPVSRSKIKAALIRAATDNDPFVRREAVDGLARVGDQESIALLEKIARTDPYRADFLQGTYVVREAATKALQARRPK